MKKYILLLFIAISTCFYAQNLTVTPNGLVNSSDNEKSYIVLDIDGKTSKQLYDKAISYINLYYKSPDDVIKGKIEGDFVKYITHAQNFLVVKRGGIINIHTDYTIQLNFKDNKVKFEIIELDMYATDTNNNPSFRVECSGSQMKCYPIYDKKGKLKMPDVKDNIEIYFNSQSRSLENYLNDKVNDDEW